VVKVLSTTHKKISCILKPEASDSQYDMGSRKGVHHLHERYKKRAQEKKSRVNKKIDWGSFSRMKSTSFSLRPLARAVAVVTAASTPGFAFAEEQEDSRGVIEEIIVTATKREADMQDVPQSIQAFNDEQIRRLGFNNMDEYIKAIPSLSTVTTSPGRNEVVFRGISTGSGEWRTDSGSAVYLGDVPMTSATQAVDPRTVDLERIEALPGPQGTMFGSSSQSGALRIIPNRPDFNGGYGAVDVGATSMSEGDSGHKIEAWVNAPIVDDRLAIRAMAFDTKTGGYIDNVLGTNVFTNDDNADAVEDDFNEWEQSGGRVTALWRISDDWDLELMAMQQSQKSEGDWKSDPNRAGLDDLEIVRFHKDVREDDWWIAALTITGDLGFAEFKSVTSYLDREIFYEFDGTVEGQIRAQRVLTPGEDIYYNVFYDTGFQPETAVNDQTAERVTQEFRLASYGDSRFQWMLGAFYEKTEDYWDYTYAKVENLGSTPFGQYFGLGFYLEDTDDWYEEEYKATTKQIALYGEVNYRFTDSLTATVGARWFEFDRDRTEFKSWPEGNAYDTDIYEGKDDDTLYKFSVDYHFDVSKMVYYLYSEGFRLGGFNSRKNPASVLPDRYDPDSLINNEVGLKSQWLDNRLQFNASAYQMEWEDIQTGLTDPDDWTAFGTVNMGDAEISGIEATLTFWVTDQLKVDASYAKSDSEMKDDYFLSDFVDLTDPASQDYQMGADGQSLAISPPSKWWIGIEYTIPAAFGELDLWFRYDHTFQEEMYHDWWNALNDETGSGGTQLIGDYEEASFQVGLESQDNWSLTFSVWNLHDDRNAGWVDSGYDGWLGESGTFPVNQYANMPSYNRPREFELTFRKYFNF